MAFVILFIIISIITGFLLTYFLSARYSIFERVAYGTVIGLGLHTWIVYLFSLLWGLSGKSIYIPAILLIVFCSVILIIKWAVFKENILNEILEIKNDFLFNKVSYFAHIAVFSFFTTIFWRLFIERSSGKRRDVYWPSKQLWRLTAPSGLHHIFLFGGKSLPGPIFCGQLVYPFYPISYLPYFLS